MVTVGSLFDGIGGWQLAAKKFGAVTLWSSEIEAFPKEVAKRHFPDTLQLGDVRGIRGDEITPVDIICAGSPCQDMSIAGKRAGLDGQRSSLFKEAIRILREMRAKTNGVYPKFFIWENVPGAFSSNHGHDFQAVLSEIAQTDIPMPKSNRWAKSGMARSESVGIAWRTLDAQYWGVPQRRQRIFLIAGFGTFASEAEILFKPTGLQGNTAEIGRAAQRASTGTQKSPYTSVNDRTADSICANDGRGDEQWTNQGNTFLKVCHNNMSSCNYREESRNC